ncbi:MAG: hypothetical protein L6R39_003883 [Caloplaca ligustica]|nr:MAG: hypothetical protein L6R39_003883 [Caloplaca ligustica]
MATHRLIFVKAPSYFNPRPSTRLASQLVVPSRASTGIVPALPRLRIPPTLSIDGRISRQPFCSASTCKGSTELGWNHGTSYSSDRPDPAEREHRYEQKSARDATTAIGSTTNPDDEDDADEANYEEDVEDEDDVDEVNYEEGVEDEDDLENPDDLDDLDSADDPNSHHSSRTQGLQALISQIDFLLEMCEQISAHLTSDGSNADDTDILNGEKLPDLEPAGPTPAPTSSKSPFKALWKE